MPTRQGKKFCINCQKNVFDLRRKSDDKIAAFFNENLNPCVIIYQDQLNKISKKNVEITANTLRYLPYAASVIAIVLLPTLTLAQSTIIHNTHNTIEAKLLLSKATDDKQLTTSKQLIYKSYTLSGKVIREDKKGKYFSIYYILYDSTGHYLNTTTIGKGKLGINGGFKLKLTKEQFDSIYIARTNVWISLNGIRERTFPELKFDKNKIAASITILKNKFPVMGYL